METNCLRKNMDRKKKHLFDGSDLNVYEQKYLNLGVGAPGPDILVKCCDIFEKATIHRMKIEAAEDGMLFQYGPTVGILDVRQEIAKYLTGVYESDVNSEDIIVTTGATQGLQVIVSTLLDMNGYIFVDEVTYMIALDVFKQFTTIKVVAVKLNPDGVDIDAFREILKKHRFEPSSKMFWGLYYAIPTYHNPTGILFSDTVCRKLVDLAREFNILVSCDDVYNALYYASGHVPNRLFAYDDPDDSDFRGNVISNGSFSKLIGPGVRFGWLEAPPRCKEALEMSGILVSGGCLNNYTSGIMTSLLELGLAQSHIEYAKELYKERMNAAIDVLRKNLPDSCSFLEPKGGYFIWIEIPKNRDVNDLLKVCLDRYKVFFLPGNRFALHDGFKNCLRISIAFHKKDVLIEAVSKLCDCLTEYLLKKE